MSGLVSKSKSSFAFLPKTNFYGEYLPKFGEFNVLYAKVAKVCTYATFDQDQSSV